MCLLCLTYTLNMYQLKCRCNLIADTNFILDLFRAVLGNYFPKRYSPYLQRTCSISIFAMPNVTIYLDFSRLKVRIYVYKYAVILY